MTFSPPVFITIGDEYDKKNGLPERYKGSTFKVSGTKKGAGLDALFTKKFLSLSEGDKYVDPGTFEKRNRLECEKKKLTPEGFKYTNVTHKPCGSGSYFGTFSEKAPPKHEVEFVVTKKDAGDKGNLHLKNILTNPPKKGTFGFSGTTLSKGDEFKYISDPYEGERRREALNAKESSKRIVGPPFKGACRRGGFFDESSHGVSKVYTIDKALPAKRSAHDDKKTPLAKAWKPAGRLVDVITKPPEYQEDPYELKEKALREQRKREKAPTVWKPIGGSKSMPTRSIKFTPS